MGIITYLIAERKFDQNHAIDFVNDTNIWLCQFLPHR
jgi:hypothetical protein